VLILRNSVFELRLQRQILLFSINYTILTVNAEIIAVDVVRATDTQRHSSGRLRECV
jgi:hypothetical protein